MTHRVAIANLGNRTGDLLKVTKSHNFSDKVEEYYIPRGQHIELTDSLNFVLEVELGDHQGDEYKGAPALAIFDRPDFITPKNPQKIVRTKLTGTEEPDNAA